MVGATGVRDRLFLSAGKRPNEARPCDFNILPHVDWKEVSSREGDELPAASEEILEMAVGRVVI
jgi:hypothetical protein